MDFFDRPLDKDFSAVKDLQNNPRVVWQNKYYWTIFFLAGLVLPTLIGWAFGHAFAGFLWGGLLRIVAENHVIYSINSVTHTFGKQRFSLKGEARDNWVFALISNGEGYHSFHHRFAFDYRNGYMWYQWDPTKWFIAACSYIGLSRNLKRASDASILQAMIVTERQRARLWLANLPSEKQSYWEQKLQDAQTNFESGLARWQDARERFREYKQVRKARALAYSRAEYANLKVRLIECRKELRLAQGHWSALLATLTIFLR